MESQPGDFNVSSKPAYGVFSSDSVHEYDSHLSVIVRRDDVDALKKYLVTHPYRLKGPGSTYNEQGGFWPDAFDYAATWGATSVLGFLLDYELKHPEKSFRFHAEEYGLLNLACHHGHLETVKYLLDTSQDVAADLRFRDVEGWTPLLAAADALGNFSTNCKEQKGIGKAEYTSRCEEIMMLLLDRGALANDVRRRRSTEEDLANDPMLKWTPPGEVSTHVVATVLSLAIRSARPALIQRLINEGAYIHVQLFSPEFGDSKITPLHIAARDFNDRGVELLYRNRGSTEFYDMVRSCNSYNRTPLHEAAEGDGTLPPEEQVVAQAVATFSFLLSYCNADVVNARDGGNYTALQLLMYFNYNPTGKTTRRTLRTRVARLLIEHGADPNMKSPEGRNTLHTLANTFTVNVGADCNEIQLLELIAQHGVSVQEADNAGDTPLHLAATGCPKLSAVRELLKLGAAPDVPNNARDTPLHAAANMTTAIWSYDLHLQEAIAIQDEVMQLIIKAAGNGGMRLMEQQKNALGKTPVEIRDESRKQLEEFFKRLESTRSAELVGEVE